MDGVADHEVPDEARAAVTAVVGPDLDPPVLRVRSGLRGWPARRWIVAGAVLPVLFAGHAGTGPSLTVWWAAPLALLLAGLSSLIVASYVPAAGSGRRVDLGCSPCAVTAVGTILAALVLRDSSPLDAGMGLVAGLLLAFGLAQRLGPVSVCGVR